MKIDDELLLSFRKGVKDFRLEELGDDDASEMIDRVAERYVVEKNLTWWWDGLLGPVSRIDYGDEEPFSRIKEIVGEDLYCFLVITDDEPRPWKAFRGKLSCLLEIVSDQRFFEYFLVGNCEQWCMFDTHHNQLVVVGSLVQKVE